MHLKEPKGAHGLGRSPKARGPGLYAHPWHKMNLTGQPNRLILGSKRRWNFDLSLPEASLECRVGGVRGGGAPKEIHPTSPLTDRSTEAQKGLEM